MVSTKAQAAADRIDQQRITEDKKRLDKKAEVEFAYRYKICPHCAAPVTIHEGHPGSFQSVFDISVICTSCDYTGTGHRHWPLQGFAT